MIREFPLFTRFRMPSLVDRQKGREQTPLPCVWQCGAPFQKHKSMSVFVPSILPSLFARLVLSCNPRVSYTAASLSALPGPGPARPSPSSPAYSELGSASGEGKMLLTLFSG